MDQHAQQMRKARVVKQRHEKAWLELDGVVSVGVGLTSDSELAVIVGLRAKSEQVARRIPPQVDGIRVLLVPAGHISAQP